jgi:hypothetical protein
MDDQTSVAAAALGAIALIGLDLLAATLDDGVRQTHG